MKMLKKYELVEILKEFQGIKFRLGDFEMKWRMSKENHELFKKEFYNISDFIHGTMKMILEQNDDLDIDVKYIEELKSHISKMNKLIALVDKAAEARSFDVIEEYMEYIAECISYNSRYTEPILNALSTSSSK